MEHAFSSSANATTGYSETRRAELGALVVLERLIGLGSAESQLGSDACETA
jgi:hypothetical protein